MKAAEFRINQSVWDRASKDTNHALSRTRFKFVEILGTILNSIASLVTIQRVIPQLDGVAQSIVGVLAVAGGAFMTIVVLFLWCLSSAPLRQRDEARQRLAAAQQTSTSVQDEIGSVAASLRAKVVNGTALSKVFVDIAPMIAYEPDQGQVASRIMKLLNIDVDPEEPFRESLQYVILGNLVATGVVELRHPGTDIAHPYIRSVYMTDRGRRVLSRLNLDTE